LLFRQSEKKRGKMKDIFIDNNVAKIFANPLDPEYKRLFGLT
jgi:hypothetical protein